jgi:hypothetical protein
MALRRDLMTDEQFERLQDFMEETVKYYDSRLDEKMEKLYDVLELLVDRVVKDDKK